MYILYISQTGQHNLDEITVISLNDKSNHNLMLKFSQETRRNMKSPLFVDFNLICWRCFKQLCLLKMIVVTIQIGAIQSSITVAHDHLYINMNLVWWLSQSHTLKALQKKRLNILYTKLVVCLRTCIECKHFTCITA